MISPAYYFHIKAKIQADFEICVSVPLKQFRLGNNLPTHIRENTDFPWQRPRQLPSAEAKLDGYHHYSIRIHSFLSRFCQQNEPNALSIYCSFAATPSRVEFSVFLAFQNKKYIKFLKTFFFSIYMSFVLRLSTHPRFPYK